MKVITVLNQFWCFNKIYEAHSECKNRFILPPPQRCDQRSAPAKNLTNRQDNKKKYETY